MAVKPDKRLEVWKTAASKWKKSENLHKVENGEVGGKYLQREPHDKAPKKKMLIWNDMYFEM